MAVPNYQQLVADAAAKYPEAWRSAHTGGHGTEDFIRLLAADLHAIDPRVGLNGKRGNPSDISDDALCYQGEGNQFDPTNGNARVAVIDVIAGAGGPNPQPSWQTFAEPHAAAWVRPSGVPHPQPGPTPVPPPTPVPAPSCKFQPIDLSALQSGIVAAVNMLADVQRKQAVLEAKLDDAVSAGQSAKDEAHAAKLHAQDIRAALQNGLGIVDGRINASFVKGTVTGIVRG